LADQWRRSHPKVAEHFEEHIEEWLSCLAFPEGPRRRLRTTNGLERLSQEIKHRNESGEDLPHREACLRSVTVIGRRAIGGVGYGETLLDMDRLKEHRCCYEECQGEEVRFMQQ
jgi:hypothetical protein